MVCNTTLRGRIDSHKVLTVVGWEVPFLYRMHVVCVRARGERCSKAHTAFSSILMECQAQEECISALPNHARDEHEWDGGRCDFHTVGLHL